MSEILIALLALLISLFNLIKYEIFKKEYSDISIFEYNKPNNQQATVIKAKIDLIIIKGDIYNCDIYIKNNTNQPSSQYNKNKKYNFIKNYIFLKENDIINCCDEYVYHNSKIRITFEDKYNNIYEKIINIYPKYHQYPTKRTYLVMKKINNIINFFQKIII